MISKSRAGIGIGTIILTICLLGRWAGIISRVMRPTYSRISPTATIQFTAPPTLAATPVPTPIVVLPPTPVSYPHEAEIIAEMQAAVAAVVQSPRYDEWAQTLRKYQKFLSLSVSDATMQFFAADYIASDEDLELLAAETLVIGSGCARSYADILAIEFWRYDDQHGLADHFYLIGRQTIEGIASDPTQIYEFMTVNPDKLPFQFLELAEGYPYQVRGGDTWEIIARHFNVSIRDLRNANPRINTLYKGLKLWIPGASSTQRQTLDQLFSQLQTRTPAKKSVLATQVPQPAPTRTTSGCPLGCTTPPLGCSIKGNISYNTGDRIYHVPGCEYYEQTKIASEYGERWFCTEAEAIANGWRKAKNCP